MVATASKQLGELLVDRKVLDRDTLAALLDREAAEGVPLSVLLVRDGLVSEKDLIAAVAEQVGLDFVDLAITPIRPDVNGLIPRSLAEAHTALAVRLDDGELVVAMLDPSDPDAVKAIAEATGFRIRPRSRRAHRAGRGHRLRLRRRRGHSRRSTPRSCTSTTCSSS